MSTIDETKAHCRFAGEESAKMVGWGLHRSADKVDGDRGKGRDEADGGFEGDEAQARSDVHEHCAAGRVEKGAVRE